MADEREQRHTRGVFWQQLRLALCALGALVLSPLGSSSEACDGQVNENIKSFHYTPALWWRRVSWSLETVSTPPDSRPRAVMDEFVNEAKKPHLVAYYATVDAAVSGHLPYNAASADSRSTRTHPTPS